MRIKWNSISQLGCLYYCCSVAQLSPRTAALQAPLLFTISQNLLRLMSIESVMPSNHLVLCLPILLLPLLFPSISVFSHDLVLHIRWPKYWSFSFSISPLSEYSGLISFRIGWFILLTVQRTLKSLLQYHNPKASILWWVSLLYGPVLTSVRDYRKAIALTVQRFVSKVTPLLFNMLSRLVIAFLPTSKCLLISRLQSPSAVILEPRK